MIIDLTGVLDFYVDLDMITGFDTPSECWLSIFEGAENNQFPLNPDLGLGRMPEPSNWVLASL